MNTLNVRNAGNTGGSFGEGESNEVIEYMKNIMEKATNILEQNASNHLGNVQQELFSELDESLRDSLLEVKREYNEMREDAEKNWSHRPGILQRQLEFIDRQEGMAIKGLLEMNGVASENISTILQK